MQSTAWRLVGVIAFVAIWTLPIDAQRNKRPTQWTARDTLISLCLNETTELTRLPQILAVLNLHESDPPGRCSSVTARGLDDLGPIVREGLDNVCTESKVLQVRQYYAKYFKNPEGDRLPESLGNFFLAFAMKISEACKESLYNQISTTVIPEEDRKFLERELRNSNALIKLLLDQASFNELAYIAELSHVIRDNKITHRERILNIATRNDRSLSNLQAVCDRSFRPIYEPVIGPLVGMTSNGFSVRPTKENRDSLQEKELKFWINTILLCESLSVFNIYRSDTDTFKMLSDSEVVSLLDAGELKKPELTGPIHPKGNVYPSSSQHKPEAINVHGQILSLEDKQLIDTLNKLAGRPTKSNFSRDFFSPLEGKVKAAVLEQLLGKTLAKEVSKAASASRTTDSNDVTTDELAERVENVIIEREKGHLTPIEELYAKINRIAKTISGAIGISGLVIVFLFWLTGKLIRVPFDWFAQSIY